MSMMMSANMYGVQPYSQILNHFKLEAGADKNIMKCIEENSKMFMEDGNLGLAQMVLKRVKQKQVRKLGEVYITLGFKEIQDKAGLAKDVDVEKYLMKMIHTGQMKAKINRETKTVQFTDEENMLEIVDSIEAKNRRIVELMNFIGDKERHMKTD